MLLSPAEKDKKEKRVNRGFTRGRSDALVSSSLREKIDCLEGECFCVPFIDGVAWYLYHIAIELLRDNKEAVIEDYPTFLIDEILFVLEDKSLLGIILLPLLI